MNKLAIETKEQAAIRILGYWAAWNWPKWSYPNEDPAPITRREKELEAAEDARAIEWLEHKGYTVTK